MSRSNNRKLLDQGQVNILVDAMRLNPSQKTKTIPGFKRAGEKPSAHVQLRPLYTIMADSDDLFHQQSGKPHVPLSMHGLTEDEDEDNLLADIVKEMLANESDPWAKNGTISVKANVLAQLVEEDYDVIDCLNRIKRILKRMESRALGEWKATTEGSVAVLQSNVAGLQGNVAGLQGDVTVLQECFLQEAERAVQLSSAQLETNAAFGNKLLNVEKKQAAVDQCLAGQKKFNATTTHQFHKQDRTNNVFDIKLLNVQKKQAAVDQCLAGQKEFNATTTHQFHKQDRTNNVFDIKVRCLCFAVRPFDITLLNRITGSLIFCCCCVDRSTISNVMSNRRRRR
jgi:hypothetical protein